MNNRHVKIVIIILVTLLGILILILFKKHNNRQSEPLLDATTITFSYREFICPLIQSDISTPPKFSSIVIQFSNLSHNRLDIKDNVINYSSSEHLIEQIHVLSKIKKPFQLYFCDYTVDKRIVEALESVPEICHLFFYKCCFVSDCSLNKVKSSNRSFVLTLAKCKFEVPCINLFNTIDNLTVLNLYGNEMTKTDFLVILSSGLKIKGIEILSCQFLCENINNISFPNLTDIKISHSPISQNNINTLLDLLKLSNIQIIDCDLGNLGDIEKPIFEKMSHLNFVYIIENGHLLYSHSKSVR
ncbi:MAG: hypothetical protein LBE12_15735 [Planctomycetaceae bacterium]|jgi:hypothetical protein|nr:hypothetical protein [Planctomycetaceae bacterium]